MSSSFTPEERARADEVRRLLSQSSKPHAANADGSETVSPLQALLQPRPLEASPPAEPPPLPSPPVPGHDAPPPKGGVELGLRLAVILCGVLVLGLLLSLPLPAQGVPYRVGSFIGMMIVWPAILIGLFSIGRRFRTPRARHLIVLCFWSLVLMGLLGRLAEQRVVDSRIQKPDTTAPEIEENLFDHSTLAPEAQPQISVKLRPDAAPPPTTTAAAVAAEYDFSPGSDQRLIKLIESAQEERYRSIVAAYVQACRQHPGDAVLALERVRFIERFAYAEDAVIAQAEDDLSTAKAYLTGQFPDAPGTVLHTLERLWGPEFDAQAVARAASVRAWPAADRARFFLLRAQRTEDQTVRQLLARQSFDAKATVEAGLLILEAMRVAKENDAGAALLDDPVFSSAEPWQKVTMMNFLFDAGQTARALTLYEEIKAQEPTFVQSADLADRLAAAGEVKVGRELMGQLPISDWNRARVLRQRFEFELEHGDAGQALAAYRALRATGFMADPLLRDRVALWLKHPGTDWNAEDLLGVGLLLVVLATCLALPAVILLPMHYWSLLRARRGRPSGWPAARWGLREVWVLVGLILVVETAALWAWQPEALKTWWGEAVEEAVAITPSDSALLTSQFTIWAVTAALLALALWRARAWRLLSAGNWTWGKTVGMALAGTVALRIGLLGYAAIWPGAIAGETAGTASTTMQLMTALLKHAGPAGMIACLAVVVPVIEELLFRGVLLQAFAKHIPFAWANGIQALLFALVHENLRLLPFFTAFGVVCGLLARRSGGLLPPIAVHFGNNLIVCLVLIAAQ